MWGNILRLILNMRSWTTKTTLNKTSGPKEEGRKRRVKYLAADISSSISSGLEVTWIRVWPLSCNLAIYAT
jgi:hypothetical protein